MTEQGAKALAAVLDGDALFPMPATRSWGVVVERPDGQLTAIEDNAGWVYRDRRAYEAFQQRGDQDGLLRAGEWPAWGLTEAWAKSLARLIGGEPHQSGGNVWVVLYARPDGKFAVIGDDGAEVYESADHYERYYDGDWPEPEYIHWADSPA